eukprot:3579657-Prymnesium_polylepis.1
MGKPKRGSSGRHPQRPPSPVGGRCALPEPCQIRGGLTQQAEAPPRCKDREMIRVMFIPTFHLDAGNFHSLALEFEPVAPSFSPRGLSGNWKLYSALSCHSKRPLHGMWRLEFCLLETRSPMSRPSCDSGNCVLRCCRTYELENLLASRWAFQPEYGTFRLQKGKIQVSSFQIQFPPGFWPASMTLSKCSSFQTQVLRPGEVCGLRAGNWKLRICPALGGRGDAP